MSEMISARLPDAVASALRRRAKHERRSVSSLVAELVDEGIRMRRHPGVFFVEGAAGRRARLHAGQQVWPVVAAVKMISKRRNAEKAIANIAESFCLTPADVHTALAYYADYPREIDAFIEENDRLFAEGKAAQDARDKLLRREAAAR